MDTQEELRLSLINKIAKCKADALYFKEQVKAANEEFRQLLSLRSQLSVEEYSKQFVEAKNALDDSNTNLNTETKALKYYEAKLAKGDFSTNTFSTAEKRKSPMD